jgi:hypothetical protein
MQPINMWKTRFFLLEALEAQASDGFDTFSKQRPEFGLFIDSNPGPTNVAANEAQLGEIMT